MFLGSLKTQFYSLSFGCPCYRNVWTMPPFTFHISERDIPPLSNGTEFENSLRNPLKTSTVGFVYLLSAFKVLQLEQARHRGESDG